MKNNVPFVITFVPFLVEKPSFIQHIYPQITDQILKKIINCKVINKQKGAHS
jgi:hypothetical protein